MKKVNFWELERSCETTFRTYDNWCHLYTPGKNTSLIFTCHDDYRYAMNLMARSHKDVANVKIVAFEIMSNHIHVVASGLNPDIRRFFELFRSRLSRFLSLRSLQDSLSGFKMSVQPIPDLKALRNAISYVNRNGYVADSAYTPFSYPWGTGRYYFNSIPLEHTIAELQYDEVRSMLKCRGNQFSGEVKLIDGYIAPPSYCDIELGMSFFRNAQHYFYNVSKNVEAYSEIAEMTGDGEYLTDTEMYSQLVRILSDRYSACSVRDLSRAQKLDIARAMHFEYRSSNGQICRLLNLASYDVDALFPL